jgi:hypothetical protein
MSGGTAREGINAPMTPGPSSKQAPLLSEVLSDFPNPVRVEESDCWTSCPTCGQVQAASLAGVDRSESLVTTYICTKGCGPILIISTPGVVPWEGRGYRVGDWMIRNPTDLFFRPRGAERDVLIPASLAALE